MRIQEFEKQYAEKSLVIEGLQADLMTKTQELNAFVQENLGFDPNGSVTVKSMLNFLKSFKRMSEGDQCEPSK